MNGLRIGIFFLGLTGGAWGAEPALTREGPYWVQVLTGSEALTPSARVRITSPWQRNAFRGRLQNQLWYSLKVRR